MSANFEKETVNVDAEEDEEDRSATYCDICQRQFVNEWGFSKHMDGRPHKDECITQGIMEGMIYYCFY